MKFAKFDVSNLKTFVVPTLILITIILIIPFAFIPLLNNVKETNDKLKQEQLRLDGLSTKLDLLNSLDENEVNENLAIAEQALPVGKSLAPLVVGLQNLAIGSRLKVDGITLSPGKVATESASISTDSSPGSNQTPIAQSTSGISDNTLLLELNLIGTVRSLENFLEKLQISKRISIADNVSLESGEGSREFNVAITLHTPFRPVPTLSGDIFAEPLPQLSDQNLTTLGLVENFGNVTNIQINEVRTNVVRDPFTSR